MKNVLHRIIIAFTLLTISQLSFAASNNVHTIPQLAGGLDLYDNQICQQSLQQDCAQQQNDFFAYSKCRLAAMEKYPSCTQNLAINKQVMGFSLIKNKNYGKVDVVYADVVGADHSSQYFMITNTGELIEPTVTVDTSEITKQYPNALFLPIIVDGFPTTGCLPDGQTLLIFQQQVNEGCLACKKLGVASVGYAFSKTGDYLGAELLTFTAYVTAQPD